MRLEIMLATHVGARMIAASLLSSAMFGREQPWHSKRSFAKWPKSIDSLAYDAYGGHFQGKGCDAESSFKIDEGVLGSLRWCYGRHECNIVRRTPIYIYM